MLSETEIVARTVWGEARGESPAGWAGVAHVIRNRVAWRGRKWWGGTFRDVCLKPAQFDCWLPNDVNFKKLLEIDSEDPTLTKIRDVVEKCLIGEIADPTGEATSYLDPALTHPLPKWATLTKPTAVIGRHSFWRVAPSG